MAVRRTSVGVRNAVASPRRELSDDAFAMAVNARYMLRRIEVIGGPNPGICGDYDKYRITWRSNGGFNTVARAADWSEGLASDTALLPGE